MNANSKKKTITLSINIAVFIFIDVSYFISLLFEPETQGTVPWDFVFENSPLLAILGAVVISVTMLGVSAQIIHIFWNRFVVDIFKIREIVFQEALSIVLIIALLFSESLF